MQQILPIKFLKRTSTESANKIIRHSYIKVLTLKMTLIVKHDVKVRLNFLHRDKSCNNNSLNKLYLQESFIEIV